MDHQLLQICQPTFKADLWSLVDMCGFVWEFSQGQVAHLHLWSSTDSKNITNSSDYAAFIFCLPISLFPKCAITWILSCLHMYHAEIKSNLMGHWHYTKRYLRPLWYLRHLPVTPLPSCVSFRCREQQLKGKKKKFPPPNLETLRARFILLTLDGNTVDIYTFAKLATCAVKGEL